MKCVEVTKLEIPVVNHSEARVPFQGHTVTRRVPGKPPPTTVFERFLLMTTVAVLPLQSYIPTVQGVSALFLVFAGLGGYVLLWRPKTLVKTLQHPVFLAGYLLVGLGLLMEFVNNSSGYDELLRIAFMLIGGILIASLCRDRMGLLFSLYGFLLAGVWLSSLLFFTSYGLLSKAQFTDFKSASQFRSDVLEQGDPLSGDRNDMAFFAGRGALIALVLALTAKASLRRYLFLALGTFCVIATFLPMSRSGIMMLVMSCGAVLYAYGIKQPKVIVAVGVLALGVLVWVPEAVYTRFSITTEKVSGQYQDSRTRLYEAVVTHLPEYVLTGVGRSHYYGAWGSHRKGFTRLSTGEVVGTHNCFVQITMYWGIVGLSALLLLYWQAYRYFPKPCGTDPLRLCLLGIAVSMLVYSLVVHTVFAKEFSLALGLLVGSARWIWPQRRIARTGFKNRRIAMRSSPRAQGGSSFGVSSH